MSKENGTNRLDIKPTQVAAGALASVTAAVLGSKLGVAGTVTGAGLASVIGTVGTSMYQRSIEATRERVRTRIRRDEPPAGASEDAATVRLMVSPPKEKEARAGRRRWPVTVAAVAVAFVLGMGVLTLVELVDGHATSDDGNRTTVGALFGQPAQSSTPPPTGTPSGTPTSTPTSTPPSTTSSTPPPSSTDTSTSTTTPTTTTTTTTTAPSQQPTGTSAGPPPGAS
jgi:hypothetical protein